MQCEKKYRIQLVAFLNSKLKLLVIKRMFLKNVIGINKL